MRDPDLNPAFAAPKPGGVAAMIRQAAALGCAVAAPVVVARGAETAPAPAPVPAPGKDPSWLERLISDWLPDSARGAGFILHTWQWIALAGVLVLALLLSVLVKAFCVRVLNRLVQRAQLSVEDRHLEQTERPLALATFAGVCVGMLPLLNLPKGVHGILSVAGVFLLTTAGVWAVYRLVDIVAAFVEKFTGKTNTTIDDALVPFARKALKIIVVAFGVVFVAQNLNIEVGSLLAGLGLGGLAFALAAKDTVENVFGSLTVLIDQPFNIGDWVIIGEVEGSIESVGLRTTKIRTFYNSLVTIPNGQLMNRAIDNMGKRRYRRIKTMISVTYDTAPETIEAFTEGIRELIRRHPYTRKDFYHVYFNEFGGSSLNILLYAFVETPEWATELREKHRLYLDIVRLARRLGVEFAFPTQTLHLGEPSLTMLTKGQAPRVREPDWPEDPEIMGRREAADLSAAHLGENGALPAPVAISGQPSEIPPPLSPSRRGPRRR